MQQPQTAPKQVENKKLDHKYEVLENGDVKVTQTNITESIWDSRSFISLVRQNEEALKNTKEGYSNEHIQKLKKQEEDIKQEIEKMTPIMAESSKLAKIAYDKMMYEGMLRQVKQMIAAKELNEGWWANVWAKMSQEKKNKVMSDLTAEDKSNLAKIVTKLKRKGVLK